MFIVALMFTRIFLWLLLLVCIGVYVDKKYPVVMASELVPAGFAVLFVLGAIWLVYFFFQYGLAS